MRAQDRGVARWQDRLETPWKFFADGCHCNRDTVAKIEASPLTLEQVQRGELPKSPPITKPMAWGRPLPTSEPDSTHDNGGYVNLGQGSSGGVFDRPFEDARVSRGSKHLDPARAGSDDGE